MLLPLSWAFGVTAGAPLASTEQDIARLIRAEDSALIYETDFTDGAGSEWSPQRVELSPNGEHQFLGRFINDAVTLELGQLPPHQRVDVSLDLFTIMSWDGNNPEFGPDVWRASLDGTERPYRVTFSNDAAPHDEQFSQSYPDTLGHGTNPGLTGAEATNELGYTDTFAAGGVADARYSLRLSFLHTGDSLTLRLSDYNQTDDTDDVLNTDESWGIDNVRVKLGDAPLCQGQPATHLGGAGGEALYGTSGRDVIVAGRGSDEIRTFGGADLVCAGPGRDLVRAGAHGDTISGGSGRDVIHGGNGPDLIKGNAGEDRLCGGRKPDHLRGGPDADTLVGGDGDDRLRGGRGVDQIHDGRGTGSCTEP